MPEENRGFLEFCWRFHYRKFKIDEQFISEAIYFELLEVI